MDLFHRLTRRKPIALIGEAELLHGGPLEGLKRSLGVRDLTALGIAAIIGAGIFSTIGKAAAEGGPATSMLFVFTAVACGFSALCYAEFASRVPAAGSAYTYAYVSFGELAAWIIGWDLLMEYAIGNIAVAISWSDYFTSLMDGFHLHIPNWLSMDYLTAYRGQAAADALRQSGQALTALQAGQQQALDAWQHAPNVGGLKLIFDAPALLIVALITYLVYIGISETKRVSNLMVGLKLVVILAVIAVGATYVTPSLWTPFAPNGLGGVMKGVSAVFFAYIGFDALSTTAEECKNPQRDLPKAMFLSLGICTVLYVAITLVLTGMVASPALNVGDPLAFVFSKVGLPGFSLVIAISAVVAMASVLLVFQLGQPRIWMNMSRDGLLGPRFARIHPKYRTPSFATIVTGFVVAVPALFMNLTEVTDLTSIGTLFAFVLVCGGILLLPPPTDPKAFRVPYVNGGPWLAALWVGAVALLFARYAPLARDFFEGYDAGRFFAWETLKHKLPHLLFFASSVGLVVAALRYRLSLIPCLGLLSCLYLMSELGYTNWLRFLIWLIIGLGVYFTYGIHKSKLNASRKEV